MSQQNPLTPQADGYEITLTANPTAQLQVPAGAVSNLTATVVDRSTHRPAENVQVTFSSTVPQARFSAPTARTDHNGRATTRVTFPYPANPTFGGGRVPVLATARNDSDSLQLVFYSQGLRPVQITNLQPGNIIDNESITAGVQAVIYPWPSTEPGNIYTLYWGNNSVQRAFNGSNFPWVVDIAETFTPQGVFTDGNYQVFYELTDNAGNFAECKPVEVTVKKE